ncbi:MAG TPA: P-loop NTPase [Rectinemataceae bacterium]|nr:P-loop NTPase [Rectinemataceae bacterium]
MAYLHFDEAKRALSAVAKGRASDPGVERRLFVVDFIGRIRLVQWDTGASDDSSVNAALGTSCGQWWTEQILHAKTLDPVTRKVYEDAWGSARSEDREERIRILDRHRSRTGWFMPAEDPPWSAPGDGPAIVVFYSFKGGLGRSTLVASHAIQRARAGERVCVLDLDLDSPGIGKLLSADTEGRTARWGIVDYLMENPGSDAPLDDYSHRCDRVSGGGQITVFPAGTLDEAYVDKLARVDLEEGPGAGMAGIERLIARIHEELKPSWILIDARTGISELGGRLLSGLAHTHVLLGTNHAQSWEGLVNILNRLGKERLLVGKAQGDTILVHAMVPMGEAGKIARIRFSARAETEYDARYYLAEDDGTAWSMDDKALGDAPHVSVAIEYSPGLADYGDIADVAGSITSGPYEEFSTLLANRFIRESEE